MIDSVGKRIALLLAGCALLAFCGSVQASVLAHWTFEENGGSTVNDISGNGYHGTLMNFPDTSANAGQYEGGEGWTAGALNFPGYTLANGAAGAGVVVTSLPAGALTGKSFTLEAILSHNSPKMGTWSPFFNTDDECCWFFGKASQTENLHFNFTSLGSANSILVPAFDGNPHHIAVVFDNVADTVATYFDHQLVGLVGRMTGTINSKFSTGDEITLGGSFTGTATVRGGGERWDGFAYEARITVDEALTPAQFLAVPTPTVTPPTPQGDTITYADFSDPSDLRARGSAGPYNGRLRLTSDVTGSQSGAYWVNGPVQFLSDLSFNTKFAFEISRTADINGADGMSFVIQNGGPDAMGWSGGSLGLDALAGKYMAVELDTYKGGIFDTASSPGNHIAIDLSGVAASVAETADGVVPELVNAGVGYIWVDYNGVTDVMDVYYATTDVKPDTPILSTTVDLAAHFGGATDLCVGFVGATGSITETHDVLNWEFTTIPEPSSLALIATALVALAGYGWRRKK
ncbi:MAG: PEP-CTERM sorting domain-containing protein [Pirellulales bacterium]|nr:PEP-CTERM sorting domain-containing protein [Pirellulales bacterium]